MEMKRLKSFVICMFNSEYEPNSYTDDNFTSCINDLIDSKFIYTEDAKKFVDSFGLIVFQLFLQGKANGNQAIIDFPIEVEDIAKTAMTHFCFEYVYTDLLKAKQEIDKRGW